MSFYAILWLGAALCILTCTGLALSINQNIIEIDQKLLKVEEGLNWPLTRIEIWRIIRKLLKDPNILQEVTDLV